MRARPPWRPRDIEQREGRILRQGNSFREADPKTFKVRIYRYATEDSFDTLSWQILDNKKTFISQIMIWRTDTRTIEDLDKVDLSYAEMKAATVGNPLITEKIALEHEARKLGALKRSHDGREDPPSDEAQHPAAHAGGVQSGLRRDAAAVEPKVELRRPVAERRERRRLLDRETRRGVVPAVEDVHGNRHLVSFCTSAGRLTARPHVGRGHVTGVLDPRSSHHGFAAPSPVHGPGLARALVPRRG
jgi:hypothetical protein